MDISVPNTDFLICFAVGYEFPDVSTGGGLECHLVDFDLLLNSLVVEHLHGGGGIGRESTDEIDYSCSGQLPIDGTVGLEDFGGRLEAINSGLGTRRKISVSKAADGAHYQSATDVGKTVMEGFGSVVGGDGGGLLEEDAAFVDVLVEEEGGDACLVLAVDERPVDGSGTAVLGQ